MVSGRLLRYAGERWLAVLGMANFAIGKAMRATGWLPLAITGSVVLGFALPRIRPHRHRRRFWHAYFS